MKYFSKDYKQFFEDLANNNHKEWFHEQKKRYEESAKKPFLAFVTALINNLKEYEPDLSIEAKQCISRINRDIRFAKDKTPYNLHLTAFVGQGGKKDKSIPGMAIRLSPEMIGIMGGSYGMDKEQLHKFRSQLAKDNKPFKQLISEGNFKEKFGGIKGEKMKRVPKEWQEAAAAEPLILHKQCYFMTELPSSLIASEKLMPTIMEYYQAMKPVNDYLRQTIK